MLDELDRRILNLIQEEFPVTERPYEEIGKRLGIGEKEVLERVRRLKDGGYIRRIGPVIERKRAGLKSMLCGTRIEGQMLEDLVNELNSHRGVTHNYERDGELNLWFTISAPTEEALNDYLNSLEERFSLKIYRFPEKRVFKIKTFFPV